MKCWSVGVFEKGLSRSVNPDKYRDDFGWITDAELIWGIIEDSSHRRCSRSRGHSSPSPRVAPVEGRSLLWEQSGRRILVSANSRRGRGEKFKQNAFRKKKKRKWTKCIKFKIQKLMSIWTFENDIYFDIDSDPSFLGGEGSMQNLDGGKLDERKTFKRRPSEKLSKTLFHKKYTKNKWFYGLEIINMSWDAGEARSVFRLFECLFFW